MKHSEYIEHRFKALDKALKLQAKEYHRRLSELNGEASRLREMQSTYIPREVFDQTVKDLKERIEVLTAVNLKGQGAKELRSWIPLILTTIGLLLAYYFNK